MRHIALPALIVATLSLSAGDDSASPAWLHDPHGFCQELSRRTNGSGVPVPYGKPPRSAFEDYPIHPIATPRTAPGVLGKYDWTDRKVFSQSVKTEISDGPDFAGRFAILRWSCGTACSNATIADVQTGKTHNTPFVGIVGCPENGDSDSLQSKADSTLLIAQGSLEMGYGHYFDEGPCGTFYFQLRSNHLHLIGCEIPALRPPEFMPK